MITRGQTYFAKSNPNYGRFETFVIALSTDITVPGTVPGSMYTALVASGDLGDPFYRDRDTKYRWVSKEDWTYSRTFSGNHRYRGRADSI